MFNGFELSFTGLSKPIVDVTTLPPTAPAPEAAAWTLMLTGFLALGASLRRARENLIVRVATVTTEAG